MKWNMKSNENAFTNEVEKYDTPEQMVKSEEYLFHGSEYMDLPDNNGELQENAFEGLLWATTRPDIAETYIRVQWPDDTDIAKETGKVHILKGLYRLRILDARGMKTEDRGDYQGNETLRLKEFALTHKCDAFIIRDLAQTVEYGNIPHSSIGILPSGLKKLEKIAEYTAHVNTKGYVKNGVTQGFRALFELERQKSEILNLRVHDEQDDIER